MRLSLNLTIVDCKLHIQHIIYLCISCLNLTIVDCKSSGASEARRISAGLNITIVDCKFFQLFEFLKRCSAS